MTEQQGRDMLIEADGIFFAIQQGTVDPEAIKTWRDNYAAATAEAIPE